MRGGWCRGLSDLAGSVGWGELDECGGCGGCDLIQGVS